MNTPFSRPVVRDTAPCCAGRHAVARRAAGHASRRAAAGAVLCLLGSLLAWPYLGCGTSGEPLVNRRPTASLTSGPVEGDTVSYSITISWSGSDRDGFVARFEYAVDPPSAFTEEEISEGGPGITSEELPGGGGNPPVTRITKTVNGETVSFDWVHTGDSSHDFMFSTPDTESVDSTAHTARFLGMHAVYVRAVDDDGAASVPDKVAFTASNVAPNSRFTRPRLEVLPLETGSTVVFEWEGTDPDSPHPGMAPDHYLFRAVYAGTLGVVICPYPLQCPPDHFLGPFKQWETLDPGVTARTLHLDPGVYGFGLVAVDENGTVEPFLDMGRNVATVYSYPVFGSPVITFTSILGTITSETEISNAQVPTNTDLEAEVTCSADAYGEECNEVRWGIDIADLESDEGWSPWTMNPVLPDFSFPRPGVHVVYIQARDTLGNVSMIALILEVLEFTFDREALYVDDSFDTLYPTDAEHDAFWHGLFEFYGISPVFEFACHGDNDRGSTFPVIPTLEDLGRYKLVVWVTFGTGYNGVSGLLKAATLSPLLKLYLKAGGKLWVVGRATVPPMLDSPNGVYANLATPFDADELHEGTFAWDFMKLRTTKIDLARSGYQKDYLWGVAPFPGEPAIFDSMTVDTTKLRTPFQVAVGYGDAVFDPIIAESDPAFRGDIDSLYVYRAYGPEKQGRASPFHHRLNAIRWHDPDPEPLHGRVQWFGFDLYFMHDTEAQETFNRSMDWFKEGP